MPEYSLHIGVFLSMHIIISCARAPVGGLPAVKEFWEKVHDQSIIADPSFLALADYAVETGELDEFLLTESQFRDRFLNHVGKRFGPNKLLPSVEISSLGIFCKLETFGCRQHKYILCSNYPI